jgi:membrane protein DedA with SNARE-associated domain
MSETLQFLLRHGYSVLFLWVFAEQIGLPLPAIPLLLAAGALAGAGRMSLGLVLFLTILAAVIGDVLWYELGRRKGIKVLQLLCRISLEPDSCVRRTEGVFEKHGARSLVLAKFFPGLNTVAPPLAGIFRMKPLRFLAFDIAGAALWAGMFAGLGYAFSGEIERLTARAERLGGWLGVLLLAALAAWILWKFFARQRFLRELRISRISAAELKEKLDSGEPIVVVDLRHSLDFEAEPETIPGAFRIDAQELQAHDDLIPRDRDVVLYCT